MLIGEMGELLTLFGRRAQWRDSREQWISEISPISEKFYHSSRTKP